MFFPATVLATKITVCDLVNGERSFETETAYEEYTDGRVVVVGIDDGAKTRTEFLPVMVDGKRVYEVTQEVREGGKVVSVKKWTQAEPPSTYGRIYRENRERLLAEKAQKELLEKMRAESRKFYEEKYRVTAREIEVATAKIKARLPAVEGEQLENLAENLAIIYGSRAYEFTKGYVAARKTDRAKLRSYLWGEDQIHDTIDNNDLNQAGFTDILGSLNALRRAGLRDLADNAAANLFRNAY